MPSLDLVANVTRKRTVGFRNAAMSAACTLNLFLVTSVCRKIFIVDIASGIKTPRQVIVKEEQILYSLEDNASENPEKCTRTRNKSYCVTY